MRVDKERLVPIVGRPNVGKSTLFNALLGRSGALTSPVPGTTRDILEGRLELSGESLCILDTGGVGARGSLGEQMSQSVRRLLERSTAVLLMVASGDKPGEEEQMLAQDLRRMQKPVLVVCNKCDNPEDDLAVWEFVRLGFGQPVPVSAVKGRFLPELRRRVAGILATSSTGTTQLTEEVAEARCAVLGKPNVGKSSLFNALLSTERSLVHEKPGTTRDAVHAAVRLSGIAWEVIDTAGISRYWKDEEHIPRESQKMSFSRMDEADVVVLVMDLTVPLGKHDLRLAQAAMTKGLGMAVALNKCDLVEQEVLSRIRNEASDFLYGRFAQLGRFPIVLCSAKTGEGVESLGSVIGELKRTREAQIANSALAEVAYEWPTSGRPWQLRQIRTRPPVFSVKPPVGSRHNVRYVSNRIRDAFGLHGVPVGIRWKERGKR